MIGDTWFDTKGRLCGVSRAEYGYGDLESMKRAAGVVKNHGRTSRYSCKVNNLKSDKTEYPKIFAYILSENKMCGGFKMFVFNFKIKAKKHGAAIICTAVTVAINSRLPEYSVSDKTGDILSCA